MDHDQQPLNEYEIALDHLAGKLAQAERSEAILVAKLATAQHTEQRLRQQIIDLTTAATAASADDGGSAAQ